MSTAQVGELTQLVGELTVLAHDEPEASHEPLRWDRIIDNAVRRITHRAGDRRLDVDLEPWETTGDAIALERAVVNVLDNAAKFSPPGSTVDVHLPGTRPRHPSGQDRPSGPQTEA